MNIFKAVENNNKKLVQDLIDSGADINALDTYGYSLLHISITEDHREIALFLINSGIDTNKKDKKGSTPLHYVADYGQLDIAKSLLENKADLTMKDKYGNQPLWTAVFNDKGRNERRDVIELFLKYGADINHKNNVNKSPRDIVYIANYENLKDIIK